LTETWLNPAEIGIVEAALPKNYFAFHVARSSRTGGGVELIYTSNISSIRQISGGLVVTSFEYLMVVYHPGHPGTDREFMEEFGSLIEGLQASRDEFIICGDFNYWLDDPGSKPFSSEFIELLDTNNICNHVSEPTHVHGHILDLLLTPQGADYLSGLETVPIDIAISDHALVLFNVAIVKPRSYAKTIEFRSYRNIDHDRVAQEIEHSLIVDREIPQTRGELIASYNCFFHNLGDLLFPLISKVIRVREDGPWYDHTVAQSRRQRRSAERRWRRLKTDSSRLEYARARNATVRQIYHCKVNYFEQKLEACRGDQQRLYSLLSDLLGSQSAPILPTSIPSDELAERFSEFFASKVARIRGDIEAAVVPQEFSVELLPPVHGGSVFNQFRQVLEDKVLEYIQESNKTNCPLDPINVSKLGPSYLGAAPFITHMINVVFVEGSFLISEKGALVRPYLKRTERICQVIVLYQIFLTCQKLLNEQYLTSCCRFWNSWE